MSCKKAVFICVQMSKDVTAVWARTLLHGLDGIFSGKQNWPDEAAPGLMVGHRGVAGELKGWTDGGCGLFAVLDIDGEVIRWNLIAQILRQFTGDPLSKALTNRQEEHKMNQKGQI